MPNFPSSDGFRNSQTYTVPLAPAEARSGALGGRSEGEDDTGRQRGILRLSLAPHSRGALCHRVEKTQNTILISEMIVFE